MGSINVGKVIVGGLVAGLLLSAGDYVINMHIMKGQFDAINVARNIDPAVAEAAMVPSIAIDIVLGLLAVFTYAAIRPRFGAGPKTAVIASLIITAVANCIAGFFAAGGWFSWNVWATMLALTTVNGMIATLVGAALYKEP
jgi:hypothetical protein